MIYFALSVRVKNQLYIIEEKLQRIVNGSIENRYTSFVQRRIPVFRFIKKMVE